MHSWSVFGAFWMNPCWLIVLNKLKSAENGVKNGKRPWSWSSRSSFLHRGWKQLDYVYLMWNWFVLGEVRMIYRVIEQKCQNRRHKWQSDLQDVGHCDSFPMGVENIARWIFCVNLVWIGWISSDLSWTGSWTIQLRPRCLIRISSFWK